ncbi:cation:proton antiporter [Exiguobacterium sp. SH3S2]|uniref:cation:proton antiporter n=1 Tax=unclassified Exiguobacterium TaxID=2644629 RepID=UPI00103BA577|nr:MULTISPECIES: cation:proton antiporter [unclassified Exiguobacterium]TCI24721.1 cation:proton antiporter [Exiguobacterium sp. SH5S4]TCI46439.1 cation:proton antiporter [Exiguobacterium sp. SH3S3]TCI57168.1 cation:proton antiporter [Exiguobacterium sp. SH5S13]TCI62081.1 cation:proton antiporter [Exiguobacterium sp. SH3S2]TCI62657.1 cation:proton antiporter [Exiguobacterium sp. SH3S1]
MDLLNIIILLGLGLTVISVLSLIFERFFFPSILAFIAIGVAVGFFWDGNEVFKVAGEIGIILLFFLLGLKFPLTELVKRMKQVWKAGVLDIALAFGVTIGIALLFGLDFSQAFLIGAVLYATSSSISARLLERNTDKHEDIKEFVLALLIFEDIFAPLILTVAPFIIQDEPIAFSDIGKVFVGFLVFGVLLFVGSRFVTKQPKIAKHMLLQDDASIGLIGLILFFAGIGMIFGLSEILGAFIAGIMLAGIHDVRPLKRLTVPVRDLFLPIFFISFGISINLEQGVIINTLFFVLIVWGVLSKWIVGRVGGRLYGLTRIQANEAGFSLAPRGEFSILFTALSNGAINLFVGLYIFVSAIIGIVLFRFSESLAAKMEQTLKRVLPEETDRKSDQTDKGD